MNSKSIFLLVVFALTLGMVACGGGGGSSSNPPVTTTRILTVNSTTPTSGVAITVSPADNSGLANGNTSFTRTYNSGTSVTLTAPNTAGGNNFSSWTGCTSSSGASCTVSLTTNTTVTANYAAPSSNVSVSPSSLTLTPGQSQQFTATVTGLGSSGVTWTVNGIAVDHGTQKSGNATVGFIDNSTGAGGLYQTPYPASGSVTITATSTADPSKSGSVTVALSNLASASGPALSVDVAATTHAINPLIYGVNAWPLDATVAAAIRPTVDRWGGNAATTYNYKLDLMNRGSDWFFQQYRSSNTQDTSDFNQKVIGDQNAGAKPMGTVPVIGWVPSLVPAPGTQACGFSVAKYGAQKKADGDCGNGVKLDGSNVDNNPTDIYTKIDETWAGGWAQYLVGKFGDAAHGGVAIYSLDNEPEFWNGIHRDVHPNPTTYDDITVAGIAVAKAVKAGDPTAEVSGPVIASWMAYFYSWKDCNVGWSSPPHWVYNGNPVDRLAHGNVPFLEYYLQQFKAAEDADPNHTRFLDYLDLHTYLSPYTFASAGSSVQQQAMINSTRGLWDPTYTDPGLTDPDDASGNAQPVPPMIIPRMKAWIAKNYPGTKTASTEYNWGMQDHISGAVAQADLLGIFGREGLDLATIWGLPDPNTQKPGLNAFKIYRNYDSAGGEFGDMGVTATSADQGKLSVYAALRTKDNVLTVVVINKTFGDLSTDLPLANFTASGAAKVYQYANADLTQIRQLSDLPVPAPPQGSTTSTLKNVTFPAMSITLFEVR